MLHFGIVGTAQPVKMVTGNPGFSPLLLCPLPQDRLKDLNSQADSLMTSSAFDTSQVKDKRDTINGRFQKIKSMAASRRAKLNESHRLHQFFRDMDDEESWIKYVSLGLPILSPPGRPLSLGWQALGATGGAGVRTAWPRGLTLSGEVGQNVPGLSWHPGVL